MPSAKREQEFHSLFFQNPRNDLSSAHETFTLSSAPGTARLAECEIQNAATTSSPNILRGKSASLQAERLGLRTISGVSALIKITFAKNVFGTEEKPPPGKQPSANAAVEIWVFCLIPLSPASSPLAVRFAPIHSDRLPAGGFPACRDESQ